MKLIDADAAIKAINEQIEQCNKALGSFDISLKDEYAVKVEKASLEAYKEQLENMPSIQPDTTTHDSIPAKTGKNDGDGTSGDCISRQAAIEVLRNRWLKTRNYEGIGEDIAEECEIYLKTLPSVQPERKRGEWTKEAACPFCGFQPWYEKDIHTLSFCPNCGADMRGKQDG